MFSAFRCARAVPDTPEEPAAARVVRLDGGCCLRPIWRGSASPFVLRGYVWVHWRYGPRYSLLPGFGGDLAVPFAPPGELHVWTTVHMPLQAFEWVTG